MDLFSGAGCRPAAAPVVRPTDASPAPASLTDPALLAAIPAAGQATCHTLAQEAARRQLIAAVPALEALCRRFKGFGLHHPVPEQFAAVRALGELGGAAAVAALRRIIVYGVVAGPGLSEAVRAAAALRCPLPEDTAAALLQHADPATRADACRCAPGTQHITALLVSLLEDLNPGVATAAAMALARRGRPEGRPQLQRCLRAAPGAALIEAAAAVADDDTIVLLGRVARAHPALRPVVLEALGGIDLPLASAVLSVLGGAGGETEAGTC